MRVDTHRLRATEPTSFLPNQRMTSCFIAASGPRTDVVAFAVNETVNYQLSAEMQCPD